MVGKKITGGVIYGNKTERDPNSAKDDAEFELGIASLDFTTFYFFLPPLLQFVTPVLDRKELKVCDISDKKRLVTFHRRVLGRLRNCVGQQIHVGEERVRERRLRMTAGYICRY